ncbi:2-oxo-4-hydroxy-4-carboxy-5-ureidoimidazoline decarboxylase [Acetobacter indonesiensis]|uniref:2-oxo-4-hydroxy-4-carboxy-5-ureidoimidazoline decarboxylase n=1 Tax=Acetobacter indonesiensis TaxID=104101 RepID=UPI000A38F853|nr:2-oxo-4-hydroxy-4-carboxy-5-ureidoimidazoline decarboxylase [Acetobacter indonesiensis]
MTESVITTINAMKRETFIATFGSVYQNAEWAAEEAYACRPFADASTLHTTLNAMVRGAPEGARIRVIRAYPGLEQFLAAAPDAPVFPDGNEAPAGLGRLSPEEFAQFRSLNKAYQERFDMPFVIYAEGRTSAEIMKALEQRLRYEPEVEIATALNEISLFAQDKLTTIYQTLEKTA